MSLPPFYMSLDQQAGCTVIFQSSILFSLIGISEPDRQFTVFKGLTVQVAPAQDIRQTKTPHLIADKKDQVIAFFFRADLLHIRLGK